MSPHKKCIAFPKGSQLRQTRSAFSLVEVTIAIGIISFAMVSILGLMPVGLSTMRQAMDQTMEAQLVRKISGEALLTPFGKIGAYTARSPFYYTADGAQQASKDDQTRYEVNLRSVATVYPGSSTEAMLSSNVTTLMIETVRRAGGGAVLGRSTNAIFIPNSGTEDTP